jgi:hypothetical protein
MLASPGYIEQNRQLHEERDDFGAYGHQWAPELIRIYKARGFSSLLDYGAGKQKLAQALAPEITVACYDPAVPEISARPVPADFVVCTDVLEHIEPECLTDVLADIAGLTRKLAFLEIATFPAAKTLPDGRNAHLIVEPPKWWLPKLNEHFAVQSVRVIDRRLIVYAVPIRRF